MFSVRITDLAKTELVAGFKADNSALFDRLEISGYVLTQFFIRNEGSEKIIAFIEA
jgi:hypothetical protein